MILNQYIDGLTYFIFSRNIFFTHYIVEFTALISTIAIGFYDVLCKCVFGSLGKLRLSEREGRKGRGLPNICTGMPVGSAKSRMQPGRPDRVGHSTADGIYIKITHIHIYIFISYIYRFHSGIYFDVFFIIAVYLNLIKMHISVINSCHSKSGRIRLNLTHLTAPPANKNLGRSRLSRDFC